ncbi:MAG TPA: helix-turn-helix transcriptional regulator [Acidobacteriaceae bacterium]|nr:helix-turn-helix transcriptional regulator [Acidobacteriaceae bacterium]
MPPLSPEFHAELRGLESHFRKLLGACISSRNELTDPEGAFEYARTYVVEFYKRYYGFYSNYPAIQDRWEPAAEVFAFQRVIHCVGNFSALGTFFDRIKVGKIRQTISDYIKRTRIALEAPLPESQMRDFPTAFPRMSGKQAASYTLAGVDLKSASPLLRMVHEAQQRAQETRPSGNSLGEQIRLLREDCRLTNEDLAAALGVDRRSVVRHISNDHKPAKRHLAAYEKLFSERLGRKVRIETSPQR